MTRNQIALIVVLVALLLMILTSIASAKTVQGCEVVQTAQGFYVKADPDCQMTADFVGHEAPAEAAGDGDGEAL